MRPRIIISCGTYDHRERRLRPSVTYAEAIWRAGGMPSYVPAPVGYGEREAWVEAVLEGCDGILLSGGGDVLPELYGGRGSGVLEEPDLSRDRVEMEFVRRAAELNVPVLGICRGCQVVNVAFGGTLIGDIPRDRPSRIGHGVCPGAEDEHRPVHDVIVQPDSILARAYGTGCIPVNSMHHQAVDRLGTDLVAVAVSPDGLIEGIEHKQRWIVGVQWHPERMVKAYPKQLSLFSAFVSAAASGRGAA